MGQETAIERIENRRSLPFLGVSLVVIGNLIPWACYRGYSTGCEQGLEWWHPHFSVSPAVVIVFAMLLLVATFLLRRVGLALDTILWTELVLLISLCVILYTPFIFPPIRFYNLVQPLIVLSSALLLWLVLFLFIRSTTWKRLVDYGSVVLALLAMVRLSELTIQQVFQVGVDGTVSVSLGLPFIFIGSLIVKFTSAKSIKEELIKTQNA